MKSEQNQLYPGSASARLRTLGGELPLGVGSLVVARQRLLVASGAALVADVAGLARPRPHLHSLEAGGRAGAPPRPPGPVRAHRFDARLKIGWVYELAL